MASPTCSESSTLALAVKTNVWPDAFTLAVAWPAAASIAVTLQQAPDAPVAAGAALAAGALSAGGAAAGLSIGAAGAGAGAVGPLVIEQHTVLPLSETWRELKFAYTPWPTRSCER
jgi:hypothetical protein